MARRGQSLRELARLANVAGDMRAAKFYEGKRKGAEALLSKMTDKAKKAYREKMLKSKAVLEEKLRKKKRTKKEKRQEDRADRKAARKKKREARKAARKS